MRLTLRVAAMAALLLFCLPFHYLWKLIGRRSPWPRLFLRLVGRIAGMRTRIVGTPLPGPVLYLANHLSWLDIVVVAGAAGAAFVSKDEVARWPIVGWLASLNNSVFIARAERGAVRGQADALRQALARAQPVALFPEGTTGDGETLLPFRASLLASLFPPIDGLHVQPIAIDYGEAARDIAWIGDESALANARRILSRPRSTLVTLTFLDPLDPAALGDRKALASRSRDAIGAALTASAPQTLPL